MVVRKFPIAVMMTLLLLSWAGVFAQTTNDVSKQYCESINICGSAPQEFTRMMDLAQELINAMHTIGTKWEYIGKYVNPNRFEGDTFIPPKLGVVSKITKNVWQKLNFLAATTAIFTSPQQWWWLKDMFAGILTLFKNKIFGRDLQVVEKIDASLTQKRYELWLWWGWIAVTINDANVNHIQKILDAYQKKGLLTKTSSISNGASYVNVASMVGRILAAMKSYLATNNIDQFTPREKWNTEGKMMLWFEPVAIQSMDKQYTCARATNNICDNAFKQFKKNMARLSSGTIATSQKAISWFVDAAKRLTQLFKKNPDPAFQSRERELLDTYYGTQQRTTGLVNKTIDDGGALKSLQQIRQQRSGAFTNRRTATIEAKSKDTNAIDQIKTTASSSDTAISSTDFATWIRDGMNPFLESQQRDMEMISFSDVKDITPRFTTIGQQITAAKELLGSKDSSDATLIKELVDACKLQWWNLGQVCQ